MAHSLDSVVSALSYVKDFAGSTIVIKLGGAALKNASLIDDICRDLIMIRAVGVSPIVVHGGGPAINAELTKRGLTWDFFEGQRVTTPEMMETIEMVLCGQVNRTIVRSLSRLGARAVGMSGLDARTLICKPMHPKLGRVGDIDRVNLALIDSVLSLKSESGFAAIPVIAPVGLGYDGLSYNINADWAASRIAGAMKLAKMIFVTDQDGILGADGQLISECDALDLEGLISESVVTGGMLAKVRTIIHGLESGVGSIHVINGKRPHALLEELFTDKGVGTVCRRRRLDAPAGAWR